MHAPCGWPRCLWMPAGARMRAARCHPCPALLCPAMCCPAGPGPQAFLLRAAAAYITRILSVFGLCTAPGDFLGFAEAAAGASCGSTEAVLDALSAFR